MHYNHTSHTHIHHLSWYISACVPSTKFNVLGSGLSIRILTNSCQDILQLLLQSWLHFYYIQDIWQDKALKTVCFKCVLSTQGLKKIKLFLFQRFPIYCHLTSRLSETLWKVFLECYQLKILQQVWLFAQDFTLNNIVTSRES